MGLSSFGPLPPPSIIQFTILYVDYTIFILCGVRGKGNTMKFIQLYLKLFVKRLFQYLVVNVASIGIQSAIALLEERTEFRFSRTRSSSHYKA